jgi:peptide/nickel transport system ATP-binding protein
MSIEVSSAVPSRETRETPLLELSNLTVVHEADGRRRTIVSGLSVRLERGRTLGVVGESGSGKSMTARAIIGLLPMGLRAEGQVHFCGENLLAIGERRLSKLRGRSLALIMQDPFTMLNPLMRCGSQIVELLRDEQGRRLGRRRGREQAVRRLAELGISDPSVADAYPFELSGGMRQRVGIAAALARDPDLLIADEPSTALDVTTQREILRVLKEAQEARGMGLVLITHDLRVAFSVCDEVVVLYAGQALERSPSAELRDRPQHPYTLGLLGAELPVDRRVARFAAIPGSVPPAHEVIDRCAFADRCRWAEPACSATRPALVEVSAGRWSACRRREELAETWAAVRAGQLDSEQASDAPGSVELGRAERLLVTVADLEKTYQPTAGTGRRVTALRGVSLEIARNESVGLVGESGSGKTTLGRCLLGLAQPTAGRIVIDGIDATDYRKLSAADRARVRQQVQMVFQDPYSTLNPVRTIGATLAEAVGAGQRGGAGTPASVGELLDLVGLPRAYAARKPVALSGGERQRVAVARALAVRPTLIVCDEPVSALDVSVQAQILEVLIDLRRRMGISLLFISHDLAVVRQATDRVYVLRRGEIVEHGAVDEVIDCPRHQYTRALLQSVPSSGR